MTKPAIIRFDSNAPLEVWPDFPEGEISSGTRASIGHRWIDDKATGLSAGVWEAEANLGRWMKWPVHEFMVILEGEVVMVEEDRETVIGPGRVSLFRRGGVASGISLAMTKSSCSSSTVHPRCPPTARSRLSKSTRR